MRRNFAMPFLDPLQHLIRGKISYYFNIIEDSNAICIFKLNFNKK